jgi:hypothetical protein
MEVHTKGFSLLEKFLGKTTDMPIFMIVFMSTNKLMSAVLSPITFFRRKKIKSILI